MRRGMPIVVERDAHIEGLALSLPKLSAICGIVTDSAGIPQASRRIFMQSSRGGSALGYSQGPAEVSTDAGGRFRFDGLSPGDYFPASPLDVNRMVFFSPDGTLGAATPVHVPAGKDVGCGADSSLDLRVPPNYKATYSFGGKISGDLPASVGDRFELELIDSRTTGAQNYGARAKLDAGHRFSFDKVPGGKYLLQLYGAYGPEPLMWSGPYMPVSHLLASQLVDIHDGMTEVTVTPTLLSDVTGTVHFNHVPEAWAKNFDIAQQKIMLVPREYRQPFSANLSADGSFRIASEDAGDYEVNLNLHVPLLYIQSVRLDGREIEGRYFYLNAATAAKLDIEVRDDSGQVNARIEPDESLPMAEPPVIGTCSKSSWPQYMVVLFPDPMPTSRVQARLLLGSAFGGDPKVQIPAVPPGRYRALAMQLEEQTIWWPNERHEDLTDFRQKLWSALVALAEPVTVSASGTVELTLPDRTIDVDRIAAKIDAPLDRGLFDR
jgi:hypothetical protein